MHTLNVHNKFPRRFKKNNVDCEKLCYLSYLLQEQIIINNLGYIIILIKNHF